MVEAADRLLSLSDILGYHPSSTPADTGADRLHQLCCKGDASIIISGTLYLGRDDELKPVNSLEEEGESSRKGGKGCYLLSQAFTSWLYSCLLCSAPQPSVLN